MSLCRNNEIDLECFEYMSIFDEENAYVTDVEHLQVSGNFPLVDFCILFVNVVCLSLAQALRYLFGNNRKKFIISSLCKYI